MALLVGWVDALPGAVQWEMHLCNAPKYFPDKSLHRMSAVLGGASVQQFNMHLATAYKISA